MGITPNDVGDMTFYQVRILIDDKDTVRGYRKR